MLLVHLSVDVHAGDLGHHQVAEDQVKGVTLSQDLEGSRAPRRNRHAVAGKQAPERGSDERIVVHNQDAPRERGRGCRGRHR